MKTIKQNRTLLILTLIITTSIILFGSCSNLNTSNNSENIIGTWEYVSCEFPPNTEGGNSKSNQDVPSVFNKLHLLHGSVTYKYSNNGFMEKTDKSGTMTMEYKISNDTIYLGFLGFYSPFQLILSLNDNQLKTLDLGLHTNPPLVYFHNRIE